MPKAPKERRTEAPKKGPGRMDQQRRIALYRKFTGEARRKRLLAFGDGEKKP